jgi:hypothetical protein
MTTAPVRRPRRFDTGCTIEVEHTNESLHAHVALDDDAPIGPGDKVRVHGDAIRVPFGERLVVRRTATVQRANPLERLWTKIAARFELAELYEVSFTPRRSL